MSSGIKSAAEKMKEKITLGGFSIEPTPTARKIYTITKEDAFRLHTLLTKRLTRGENASLASVFSEAIALLYSQET
ncbi:MAG: hypothetical protein K940chlam9_00449 [Chlamydiae bacterium]|nr:hypothetical protein [Chlamydiota bacterium]